MLDEEYVFCYFHPKLQTLGKIPIVTHIFSDGWLNHQLDSSLMKLLWLVEVSSLLLIIRWGDSWRRLVFRVLHEYVDVCPRWTR